MICVSVGEKSWKDAAETAGKYPFTEIRLDYLEDVSDSAVHEIISSGEGEKIATFRKTGSVSDEERLSVLASALKYGASYVDVDINNAPDFIRAAGRAVEAADAKLIISYHNFENTPSLSELDEVIEKASAFKSDIIKIACMAESDDEAERLLSLPSFYNNMVIAGMGSRGERIRSLSVFSKSLFTYACPDNGKAVAPGQLTYSELALLHKRFGNEW